MAFDPVPAARALLKIRRDRVAVAPLPAAIAPATEAEGAAVQVALAGLVEAVPPAGFKIGATGKRMQVYLGVDGPIAGFMRDEDVHHAHAALRFGDYIKPGVECEVAVRLAKDLPAGPCSFAQALAAVGEFFAGIEIVENRYGDLKQLGTPTLLADQMYHCAAVIGDRSAVDWHGLDIGALRGRISLDDGSGDEGVTTDLLGHPLNGLAWLAGSAEATAFGGLKAGQVVMLGSVTPPVWLSGPATVTVSFPPLPTVTVRLG
ncbi:MAG TPA: fumarylacetoacetate hydrolase family protein [Rhodopila sp.]|nr:fumarylacetoacetate hydrolase family protein [Rhodopila sp.]